MPAPTPQKTWTLTPNVQLPFTTLNQCMGDLLFQLGGVNQFLPKPAGVSANGLTCKGSCDGTTGAMDGTNRWTDHTKTTTRFNGAGGAQSWIVYTLASGADLLLAYDASSDDVCFIGLSPGGLYVAAGTPAQKPTATDEQVVNASALSVVGSTASADRRLHMWIDSTKKLVRWAVYRQNVLQSITRIEQFTSTVDGSVSVIANPVWGFFGITGNVTQSNLVGGYSGGCGGVTRAVVSSVAKNMSCGGSAEVLGGSAGSLNSAKPQLQGASGFAMFPLGISQTSDATCLGKVGNQIDAWVYADSAANDGDTSDSKEFLLVGTLGALAIPWDGATAPINT
jgi:hypothetical protein